MKSLLGLACLSVLLTAPFANANDDDDAELSAKSLAGSWSFVAGTRAGDDVAVDRLQGATLKITETEMVLPVGPDAEFVFEYELDTEKSPVAIDLSIKSGPVPEGKAVGIIKMKDGKVTLCYDPSGADRPEKFESTSDNGTFLFVLEKADD